MKRRILFRALALAAAASLGGTIAAAPTRKAAPVRRAAPAPRDWTRTVVATPEGGFRMGNPAARVKLVEYGSLTCPHCAVFSREAGGPLRTVYVKSGRVSWEFRPYLLFPSDPGISMLLRCRGPGAFFQLSDQLYADQKSWVARLRARSVDAELQSAGAGLQRQAEATVRAAGVDRFFRAHGMSEARIAACLADGQALHDLLAVTERADAAGVPGTPTFFINGRMVEDAATWAALEPSLRAAR